MLAALRRRAHAYQLLVAHLALIKDEAHARWHDANYDSADVLYKVFYEAFTNHRDAHLEWQKAREELNECNVPR